MASIPKTLTLGEIATNCISSGLDVLGAFHHNNNQTLILLSPAKSFWGTFKVSHEYQDNLLNPIDGWSTRVISELAIQISASPKFPFGGPPYYPFLEWAKRSNRAWISPLGMLVHDTMGMMISYHGALILDYLITLPHTKSLNPCNTCTNKPCINACPAHAISGIEYNTSKCHNFLGTSDGKVCMTGACQVRTSCPVSVIVQRDPEHNLLHMRAFKGEI